MTARIADNINPQRFSKQSKREITKEEEDESIEDPIDEREIFGKFCKHLLTTSIASACHE